MHHNPRTPPAATLDLMSPGLGCRSRARRVLSGRVSGRYVDQSASMWPDSRACVEEGGGVGRKEGKGGKGLRLQAGERAVRGPERLHHVV